MNKESKIYIAGHRGLVGSAIQRILSRHGYSNLIVKTRAELDLLNAEAVEKFFSTPLERIVNFVPSIKRALCH